MVAFVGAIVYLANGSAPGGARHAASVSASRTNVALTGATLHLAATTVHLPTGFDVSGAPCAPTPVGLGKSIHFGDLAAYAPANGGCIQMWLADPMLTVVPAGASSVAVGEHTAMLSVNQTTGFDSLPSICRSRPTNIFPTRGLPAVR